MASTAKIAQQQLLDAVACGHVPHAVFLDCTDAPLATDLARRAAALFCLGNADVDPHSCADYFELNQPIIKVDDIRALTAELSIRPFNNGGRAIFIQNAHCMNENAQNALLKTLEEPPARTLILLCGNLAALLPTICSRCQTIRLSAMPEDVVAYLKLNGASERDAQIFAAQGISIQRSLRLYSQEDYRTLRCNAQDAFIALLDGHSAYCAVKPLSENAKDAVEFMLDLAGEIQRAKELKMLPQICDRPDDIMRLGARFTSGELGCIIVLLTGALERLGTSQLAGASLDRLFTQISEAIT
ncbi:MAG: hypothetical protein RR232_06545 [Clostridia bacterium]